MRYTARDKLADEPVGALACCVLTDNGTRLRFPYCSALLLAATDKTCCGFLKYKRSQTGCCWSLKTVMVETPSASLFLSTENVATPLLKCCFSATCITCRV